MGKIAIHINCPLSRFLLDVSKSNDGGLRAEFAGALLYELGYPGFNLNLTDISYVLQSINHIVAAKETKLLHQAAQQCAGCPQADFCGVSGLITVD